MDQQTLHTSSAFDTIAQSYDKMFEQNTITQQIRPLITKSLLSHFTAGDHVLELNCGTGTDAIALAEYGIRITAIDSSPVMIDRAESKIRQKRFGEMIETKVMGFEQLNELVDVGFDGAFSNFGGFNCIPNVEHVAHDLAALIKPRGSFIACIINKVSLWEITSFFARGKFSKAFRRLRNNGCLVRVGNSIVQTWYYTPEEFTAMISPWFSVEKIYGINIFSPLPNSTAFVQRHPRLTSALLNVDNNIRTLFPFYGLGDHFVIAARRIDR